MQHVTVFTSRRQSIAACGRLFAASVAVSQPWYRQQPRNLELEFVARDLLYQRP